MNAGLPTTGIGGIFYFLSVWIMLMLEITRTIRGKSSKHSWKFVSGQLLMVLSILTSIWLTAEIIAKVLPAQTRMALTSISTNSTLAQNSQTIFLIPFMLLGSLIFSTQILRLYFSIRRKLQTNITK